MPGWRGLDRDVSDERRPHPPLPPSAAAHDPDPAVWRSVLLAALHCLDVDFRLELEPRGPFHALPWHVHQGVCWVGTPRIAVPLREANPTLSLHLVDPIFVG
eukprot:CAMPEP_0202828104 /NCGR_PEP_ID=MMETSP1389-20130828/14732_1 /ASSEMBLY_ACC=CAM_ASM_000865 /TAXON_ID=302021 /ORGANISM="Rhodomonas sp., Strain CCMP768" /LENGTH=101 /DNA_ID=CAMNT_0049501581 /DNA_START=106 /DNA_END=411 /DNA_ORIENTATION=+